MGTVRYYIFFLLLAFSRPSQAQSGNDSIFHASILSSYVLTDAGTDKPFSLSAASSAAAGSQAISRSTGIRLFVFLSPECPLCQNYTSVLNRLYQQYEGQIQIYGIIPGKTYSSATVEAFAEKYKIPFPLLIDGSFRLSHYLGATTTPQVILLNAKNELIYKGAIDNWLKDLGKKRTKATENYVQDAIAHALNREPVTIKRISPVGCLINDL